MHFELIPGMTQNSKTFVAVGGKTYRTRDFLLFWRQSCETTRRGMVGELLIEREGMESMLLHHFDAGKKIMHRG